MPLDLPPPLPPQQADLAVLEAREEVAATKGNTIELRTGDYRLLISGNSYLTEDRIRQVTSVGKTPSQVILLLNALYAAEGYLLVNVQYAREDHTIYVQVNEGVLKEVDAPPALTDYFEPFEDMQGLTETQVEPMRVLAQLKSQRAGYEISTHYSIEPEQPTDYTLEIDGKPEPDFDSVNFSAVFGNPGNRFLGRYFGLANATFHSPGGDLYGFGYARGFTGLGNARGGEDYDRYNFDYSTISTSGLYGLSAAYTNYAVRGLFPALSDDREEADIVDVAATGNQFLFASSKTRLVLEEKLGYIDSTIEITEASGNLALPDGQVVPAAGQRVQDEQYGFGRLGLTLSRSWSLFGQSGSFNGGMGYSRGFAGSVETPTDPRRTRNFDIFDGKLSSAYALLGNLVAGFDVEGQLSADDRVPQQQQWVLGGPDRLSAYLPGILVGDSGAYGRFHLQLPRWKLFGLAYRFSLFAEGGTATFENVRAANQQSLGGTRSATDAGLKLELAPTPHIQLTLYGAQPLSEHNLDTKFANDTETGFFFNLRGSW